MGQIGPFHGASDFFNGLLGRQILPAPALLDTTGLTRGSCRTRSSQEISTTKYTKVTKREKTKEETRFLPCSSPTFVLFVPFVVNSLLQVPVKPAIRI